MKRTIPGLCTSLSALLLAGCGGGSDPGPPVAPVLNWAPQAVKSFVFTWTDVASETQYRLLENPTGASGYSQVATIPADATSRTLDDVWLPGRLNASYMLQACNEGGCTDSAPVSVAGNLAAAVGYVKASNTGASDYFGFDVALSGDGNTIAVGAPQEASNATGVDSDQADNSAISSGAVYVY